MYIVYKNKANLYNKKKKKKSIQNIDQDFVDNIQEWRKITFAHVKYPSDVVKYIRQ